MVVGVEVHLVHQGVLVAEETVEALVVVLVVVMGMVVLVVEVEEDGCRPKQKCQTLQMQAVETCK